MTASRCYVVATKRGPRARRSTSRTHPNLVKKLFALEVPEVANRSRRDRLPRPRGGHRTKIAVHTRSPGSTPRVPASGRWARVRAVATEPGRRSTSSTTPGPGRVHRRRLVARTGGVGDHRQHQGTQRRGHRPRLSPRSRSAVRVRTPGSPPSSPAGASISARRRERAAGGDAAPARRRARRGEQRRDQAVSPGWAGARRVGRLARATGPSSPRGWHPVRPSGGGYRRPVVVPQPGRGTGDPGRGLAGTGRARRTLTR